MAKQTTLFVGLGSSHGDDCAGWLAADLLGRRIGQHAVIRRAAAPIDLLDWLGGIDRLAICDACQGAGPAGSWHRWAWPIPGAVQLPPRGSHDWGLSAVMRLAANLGLLPHEVLVWGVEITAVHPGDKLSAQVSAAVGAVVEDILTRVGAMPCMNDLC